MHILPWSLQKQLCWHLDFSPVGSLWDLWPSELWEKKGVVFYATKFLEIIYSSKKYDKKCDHESHMLIYIRKIIAIHFQSVLVK